MSVLRHQVCDWLWSRRRGFLNRGKQIDVTCLSKVSDAPGGGLWWPQDPADEGPSGDGRRLPYIVCKATNFCMNTDPAITVRVNFPGIGRIGRLMDELGFAISHT